MRITHASFKDFPPFKDGSVKFPPLPPDDKGGEVQFIVGANGSGKTRLLSLLLASLGNPAELKARLSAPIEGVIYASHQSRTCAYNFGDKCYALRAAIPKAPSALPSGHQDLVKIGYDSPTGSSLADFVNRANGPSKATAYTALAFRGASAEICDSKVSALQPVALRAPAMQLTFSREPDEDKIVGQCMVNLKMGAAMDTLEDEPNEGRSTKISRRVEQAVSEITGRIFSFRVEKHPEISLRVNWGSAKMMKLVQLPDGLRAIFGWLVSCAAKLEIQFPEDPNPLDANVIIVIDEPEGHLHPAWQRRALPALQLLLPNAQIFAATHSPWVISSVNSGWIHVLRPDKDGVVTIEKARPCSKGDSYIDVVEDILGVTEIYDPETETLLAEFRNLRDKVKSGGQDAEPALRKLAQSIANRSDSLSDMMGRELWQLERQREMVAEAK